MIKLEDYEARLPINNEKYFSKLSEKQKEQYLKLYEIYSRFLIEYLIKKLDLLKYDNIFKNSKNNFVEVPKEKMDLYQKLSSDKLKYIYLRNNIYIERLSEDEMEYLSKLGNKEYDSEIENFIKSTYERLVIESKDENLSISYGPDNGECFASTKALIIGFRYDKYANSLNNENWAEENNKRLMESDFAIQYIKNDLEGRLNIDIEVLQYGDFSINDLNDNKQLRVN